MSYGDLIIAKKSFFSALSDETRLTILYTLKEQGGMCVNDICESIGKDQSLVSHHMRCLRNCGFVTMEKQGKFAVYSIRNTIITDILDLSNQHVKEMSEGILHCDVVAEEQCCKALPNVKTRRCV
ncbi:MAG: metalloregulator ArsR/SmtB family transcription factor [Methanoregula sp.]|nr:metalloregulator ArsR/SmtB family transcription factor [Methanoregula sp.]